MVCPKCISHNPEQAEACHWCGNALRQEQETMPAETVVACVSCGGQINPTANFCRHCGVARIPLNEPVEAEPQFACAHCGGSLNLGDNYCKWCGLPTADSTGSTSTIPAESRGKKLPRDEKAARIEAERVAFRESIEKSFAFKDAKRVAFRKSIEKSIVLKEEQLAQKEREREVAANIAAVQKAEQRAQKEAERAEREAVQKEAARRERELAPIKPAKPAKEEDNFDAVEIAKTIVQFAPCLPGVKVSPADALLIKQVLEEFQKKSDGTSVSDALSYFSIGAMCFKFANGTATNRDMVIFAIYQFLNVYRSWKS